MMCRTSSGSWSLSLAVLRFLDWPHADRMAPEFDEERYEVARYAILKVK